MEVKMPLLRTEFNYDRDLVSQETGLACEGEGLTKQSFAEEVDINTIVRRFGLTGELPVNRRMPSFGDFTGVFDYQSAMNAVVAARESFDALPAQVRKRFHDDPQEFVEFCSDKDNLDEARKLGMVPPAEIPLEVEVRDPAAVKPPVNAVSGNPPASGGGTVIT